MKQFLGWLLLAGAPLGSVLAQNVTNAGATIVLANGATLYTSGSLTNASGTLDLSSGTGNLLTVGGDLVNASGATLTPGTSSTVTLSGAVAQQLSLNGATLANLTINNTNGGVTVPAGSNGTITGALTLTSGLVTTAQTSQLTLADGATMTGETSTRYVVGNLAAVKNTVSGATAFPNDIALTPTAPLTGLTVTRTAGLNSAQVSYGTNASGSNQGIDQIWQTSAPLTGGTVQVTWLAANDHGLTATLNQSQLWARTAAPVAGSDWSRLSGPQDASSSRTVTGTAPAGSSYSFFTVSTTSSPLPVALLSFEAQRSGDAARLTWRTASELHSDYFAVEVSADGQTFQQVGENVRGQGSKATATDYSFTDPRLLTYAANPVYYRLRQTDTDGTSTYSPVRSVRVEGTMAFGLAAFPNPHGAAGTHLQVRTMLAGPLTLAAYDATGRLLFTHSAEVQPGASALELPEAGQLASGVYYVQATQAGQRTVLRLTRE